MTRNQAKRKAVAAIRTIVEAAKELARAEKIYLEAPPKPKQRQERSELCSH